MRNGLSKSDIGWMYAPGKSALGVVSYLSNSQSDIYSQVMQKFVLCFMQQLFKRFTKWGAAKMQAQVQRRANQNDFHFA